MDLVLISISQSAATKPERWALRQSAGLERKACGFGGIFSQSSWGSGGVWLSFPALKVS